MATPFSRTLRARQADHFHASFWGLMIGIALLLIWLTWFFLARITLYEHSIQATIQTDSLVLSTMSASDQDNVHERMIVATFANSARGRVQRGQAALFRIQQTAKPSSTSSRSSSFTLPALVVEVDEDPNTESQSEPLQVTLFLPMDPQVPLHLPDGQKGTVDIEVETLSPAALVVRATGQLLDSPDLAVSPQNSRLFEQR
ncbi:MAG: hypothetical protein AAF639_00640 [Chloroflexota bacterium]